MESVTKGVSMSGGQCWSSIVATPDERAALRLGVDGEWLVACVLPEGHLGAHASDGAQDHVGRRRWLVWGDFARGAQMLRDEEPCPITELDGSPCLYYLGHSGAHRYPGAQTSTPGAGLGSLLDRRPVPVPEPFTPEPFTPEPFGAQLGPSQPFAAQPVGQWQPPASQPQPSQPHPSQPQPNQPWYDTVPRAPMPHPAQRGFPPTQPWSAPTAFDVDPDPPTDEFPALPAPPGWPEQAGESRQTGEAPPALAGGADVASLDQLFAGMPSLAPEDAPVVSPDDHAWTAPVIPPAPVAEPDVDASDAPPALSEPAVVPAPLPEGAVASHAAPEIERDDVPATTAGPSRFEPARVDESAGHRPVRVVNDYEPSLGDDAPGGATSVVYRDDPNASIMEVRPTSSDVLTTSILQVIASNQDPVRIGVPTTRRPVSEPDRAAASAAAAPLSGDDVQAMTDAVRDAAERLQANPGAADTHAMSEALRDMAISLARLADRFGK